MERIVVKVGSSVVSSPNGLDTDRMKKIARSISHLREHHACEVVLVSSGAVAAGFRSLGFSTRPTAIVAKQAAAAVGQSCLMHTWNALFNEYGYSCSQVLLTRQVFSDRRRYQNTLATLELLLSRASIPVVNENDTVSVEEIAFGDNDMLAALVAGLLHAGRLLLLSDVAAVYSSNPSIEPDAERYAILEKIPNDLVARSESTGTSIGTGGMAAKLRAARHANELGIPVYIGTGALRDETELLAIVNGRGVGTYIGESTAGLSRKRQWIGFHAEPLGTIVVDEGAAEALLVNKRSLLPAGIVRVEGAFNPGDVVLVETKQRICIGRGEIAYTSKDLRRVCGMSSNEVRITLPGQKLETIHRDSWVSFYNAKEWNYEKHS